MKKLIALFLCLVMVFGLVACGTKEETKAEEPAPEITETKEPEATPEIEVPEQPEEVALELGSLPLVKEGEDNVITIGLMQSSSTEDYDTNDYTLWVEEQTGVDLEFVYFSSDLDEAVTQLNLMIAGGDKLPDLLYGMQGFEKALMYELGEDGYFLDLKDYFEEYGYYFWQNYNQVNEIDQKLIFQYGTDPNNGEFYAYPRYMETNCDAVPAMSVINTKWLEAVGAEMPTTVEELKDVLLKFANEDPNGNGVKDELAMFGFDGGYRAEIVQYIINAFVYCNKDNVFNATEGKVWNPYVTDEYRQALIYMNDLYAEGLISPMYYTVSEDAELKALMSPADGVSMVGIAGAHPSLHFEMDSPTLYEYAALPPLQGATELGGYAAMSSAEFAYISFITADCENPVLAFRLLDFMNSPESFCRARWGVYGEDWEYSEEGSTTAAGIPAPVNVIDSSVYGTQNNRCWHGYPSAVLTNSMWSNKFTDDGSWASTRSKLAWGVYAEYLEAVQPDEIIYTLIYTEDEQKIVSAVSTQLKDYIAEAQALFTSGVMDPSNDMDWNTYLSNLEAQGMNDWLEIAQTAYTRMNNE